MDKPIDPNIERAWLNDAQRRADQIDRGEFELIPDEEVHKSVGDIIHAARHSLRGDRD